MTDRPPRIVFFGTPQFAVASLKILHQAGHDIACVVTATDKGAGRGRKTTGSPVKEYALAHHLPLEQPEKLRDPQFLSRLDKLKADLFVVVAFRMIPEMIWKMPPLGTFNLHASLLPQYRGAAPINHAIINGETRTGVTTFLINNEIDTGNILLSQETEITPDEHAGSLHDRLMKMGATLVRETTEKLYAGNLAALPQVSDPEVTLIPAPRLFPANMVINWKKPVAEVYNLIRGLSPTPGATTMLHSNEGDIRLKILECRIRDDVRILPGTLTVEDRFCLIAGCVSGAVEILSLIPEGRKPMSAAAFLRGFDPTGWELA